jgi:hypothetical protein
MSTNERHNAAAQHGDRLMEPHRVTAARRSAGTLGRVDGVALASVITSGVVGLTGGGIAIWSGRQAAKLAWEKRVQERLAESYLEVLRIVEREGQWIEASIANWQLLAEFGTQCGAGDPNVTFERMKVPQPDLSVTDRPTASAHLEAFDRRTCAGSTMPGDPPSRRSSARTRAQFEFGLDLAGRAQF